MRKISFVPEKFRNIVIAESKEDIAICEDAGLPYLYWQGTDQELGILIFRRALKRRFPNVEWDTVFEEKIGPGRFKTIIKKASGGHVEVNESGDQKDSGTADIATSPREFKGKCDLELTTVDLAKYAEDNWTVDVDVLQQLNLLPTFLGDIASVVRANLASTLWQEGWNKKLHAPMGNMQGAGEQRNLLIIDISASIPRGISATLLALMDTMAEKARADIIVTGGRSFYYPYGVGHPSIKDIRRYVSLRNESEMFNEILCDNIAGKRWGNVIAFGDNDNPYIEECTKSILGTTKVGKFWHYHTGRWATERHNDVGYANWQEFVITEEEPAYDTSWCKYINDNEC